jgi:aminoglycoside phosphotransferase (APT) family kinase protein
VSGVLGVDEDALARWIGSLCASTGPLTVTRVGLGQSNLTYRVSDAAGQAWVVRRPPAGKLLRSAHDVVREAGILSALGSTDVPTPAILGVAQAGEVTEVPLVLMSFVDGLVIEGLSAASVLPDPVRQAAGLGLPETLARVHAVDLDAVGLADLAAHTPYAARQLKRWSGQWTASRTRDLPDLDALTERLSRAIPEQHEVVLVHGDLHLRNIVISPDSGAVAAALDWELSTLGDPLADLGTTLAYWPEPGEVAFIGFESSTLPGFPTRAELVARYAETSDRDVPPAAVGFWHALGLWKLAIIAEGVLRRVRDDPRNRAAAGVPDEATIDGIVTLAHQVAAGI